MARLNVELFQTYSPDLQLVPSSTGGKKVVEDEEDFSRAFQKKVVLGTLPLLLILQYLTANHGGNTAGVHTISDNSPPSPVPAPTRVESAVSLPPDPNIPMPSQSINSSGLGTAPDNEGDAAGAARRSSKRIATSSTKMGGAKGRKGKK